MVEYSLAPMMKITTPQFRLLMRKISPSVILFTEMIVSSTVVNVSPEKLARLLGDPDDCTVVQLGGSNPNEIAESVSILLKAGWKHFNLNCGCPSDRVQHGKFGAILMLEPELVANIINTVYEKTGVIISIKTRTGVDENDSFDFFRNFITYLIENTKCTKFYIHARKCWLCGLNPKQNRNIPKLNYEFVYEIKRLYPNCFFYLNGGIKSNEFDNLQNLDGLMIGRAAIENINIFNEYMNVECDMKECIRNYFESIKDFGCPKSKILIPLNNLRKGKTLSKIYKQRLNDLIRSDVPISDFYSNIEEFID